MSRIVELYSNERLQFLLAWLIIISVYVLFRINLLDMPLDRDEGAFGYMGQLLNSGGIPYRDALDHKPPLIFHIYAFGLNFFPATARGVHLYAHAYNFLTLVTLFFVAKIYFRSTLTGLLAALAYAVFTCSPAIQGFTASTELFMLLPITLSLLFALLSFHHRHLILPFISGMFAAAACWIKPPAFATVLPIFLLVSLPWLSTRKAAIRDSLADYLKSGSVWVGGGLATSLLIVGFYAYHGAFENLVYWVFEHNLIYAGQGRSLTANLTAVSQHLLLILKGDGIVLICAVLGIALMTKREWRIGAFPLLFLLFSLIGVVPGHNYAHYFMQLAPAAALSAGYGIKVMLRPTQSPTNLVTLGYICIAGLIALPFSVHSKYYLSTNPALSSHNYFGANPFPESEIIAGYLASHTTPDETILIFGSEAQIPFLAERRNATRHIFFYPLMRAFPRHAEFQREAWKDIERTIPRYIVKVGVPTSFVWDGKAETWIIDKLNSLLKKRYSLAAWIPVSNESPTLFHVSGTSSSITQEIDKYRYPILIYKRNNEP